MSSHQEGNVFRQSWNSAIGIPVQDSLGILLVQGKSAAVALKFGHVRPEGFHLLCNTFFLLRTQCFGSASLKSPVKFVNGSTPTLAFANTTVLSPALAGAWSGTLARALSEGD
jgi:hypothetical protein